MYEEYQYMRISYLLGLFLTFSYFFGLSDINNYFDLLVDLATLTATVTVTMWLKKKIVAVGLIIYILAFNFDLLFSPIFSNRGAFTSNSFSFFIQLEILGILLILIGLVDSYFGDKYFNQKWNLKLTPLATSIILGTIVLQLVTRLTV